MLPVQRRLGQSIRLISSNFQMCFTQHTDNCKHKKGAVNEQRTEQKSERAGLTTSVGGNVRTNFDRHVQFVSRYAVSEDAP